MRAESDGVRHCWRFLKTQTSVNHSGDQVFFFFKLSRVTSVVKIMANQGFLKFLVLLLIFIIVLLAAMPYFFIYNKSNCNNNKNNNNNNYDNDNSRLIVSDRHDAEDKNNVMANNTNFVKTSNETSTNNKLVSPLSLLQRRSGDISKGLNETEKLRNPVLADEETSINNKSISPLSFFQPESRSKVEGFNETERSENSVLTDNKTSINNKSHSPMSSPQRGSKGMVQESNVTKELGNSDLTYEISIVDKFIPPLQSFSQLGSKSIVEEFDVTEISENSALTDIENSTNNELVPSRDLFNDHGNAFLIIQTSRIFKLPLFQSPNKTRIFINGSPLEKFASISIDCANKTAYIFSDSGDRITRTPYLEDIEEETFITNLHEPVGISIDWISRNIFLLSKARFTIEVVSLDAKIVKRKVLISDGIFDPKGIVVHPGRGKIFWADWGRDSAEPKLEWANEDGSDREIFFKDENVYPDSLAIDWATDELCWIDKFSSSINCSPIDSRRVHVIATDLTHISNLMITDDSFYWISSNGYKIIRKEKHAGEEKSMFSKSNFLEDHLDSIVVLPEQCPKFSNDCQFKNGGCRRDELCLPHGRKGRTCVCSDNSPYPCQASWIEKLRNAVEKDDEGNKNDE